MDKTIYFGGDIITLEDTLYTDAVLVENGIIKDLDTFDNLIKNNKDANLINLNGATMLPAFLDSHSHLSSLALTTELVKLHNAKSFDDIKNIILKFAKDNNIPKDEWIICFGYDNNNLKEKSHPDKFMLDTINIENPILLTHTSGHMGVVNQKGLDLFNIDKNTKEKPGGKIGRVGNTNEPNGYLEENAFISRCTNVYKTTSDKIKKLINNAQNIYASYGITTAQEGLLTPKELGMLKLGDSIIDIIGYVDIKNYPDLLNNEKDYLKKYNNGVKLLGYKAFLDGSPQGKTAWLTKPYENEKDYKGYPIYEDAQVTNFFKKAITENVQMLIHCNGDAACEQFIRCYKQAKEETNCKNNIRPVMIHSQMLRKDLLPLVKELDIIPSYFVAHTFYWGDVHIKNLGERAYNISPLKSSSDLNIIYTLHQDAPVIMPNMIETIWCATNRITKDGVSIGKDEIITPLDAIKAVTINASYQYFEEDIKGSIKIGKQANFVILSKNPLKIPTSEIKDIEILKTIKLDKVIFEK
ncbi:amidohydrolase [uncultured Tyzzerella sp.]|uniref:amidohydrolase n=1 Tax=uncultured Tyzzerella sp. TaxID=2321398 RepID=UPI002943B851|nr:amidohydrolase [uncultured Tyzzerella sp.]